MDIPLATPTHIEKLKERAKNIKGISGNFRLDAFASRISTFDMSFTSIAGLMSLANNKPPHEWIDLDIEAAKKEIVLLCNEFKKAELYTKIKNRPVSRQAIAFIAGIGKKSTVFEGEFDILIDDHEQVNALKSKIKSLTFKHGNNRNIVLTALAEISIEILTSKK